MGFSKNISDKIDFCQIFNVLQKTSYKKRQCETIFHFPQLVWGRETQWFFENLQKQNPTTCLSTKSRRKTWVVVLFRTNKWNSHIYFKIMIIFVNQYTSINIIQMDARVGGTQQPKFFFLHLLPQNWWNECALMWFWRFWILSVFKFWKCFRYQNCFRVLQKSLYTIFFPGDFHGSTGLWFFCCLVSIPLIMSRDSWYSGYYRALYVTRCQ